MKCKVSGSQQSDGDQSDGSQCARMAYLIPVQRPYIIHLGSHIIHLGTHHSPWVTHHSPWVTALPPDVRRWLGPADSGQIRFRGYAPGSGFAPRVIGSRPHEGAEPKSKKHAYGGA